MQSCPVSFFLYRHTICQISIQKLQESRVPLIENRRDIERLGKKVEELTYHPDPDLTYYLRS